MADDPGTDPLPITGGGPTYPQTIVSLVANDDTFAVIPVPFQTLEPVFVQAKAIMDQAGDFPPTAMINNRGYLILTFPETDPARQSAAAQEFMGILNGLLIG